MTFVRKHIRIALTSIIVVLLLSFSGWFAYKEFLPKNQNIKSEIACFGITAFNYYKSVRTTIVYMLQKKGVRVDQLRFNPPTLFHALDATKYGVFHEDGGGMFYAPAPPEFMQSGKEGEYRYNAELAIPDVYSEYPDIVAYLIGVRRDLCEQMNADIGLYYIPRLESDQRNFYIKSMVDDGVNDYKFPRESRPVLANEAFNAKEQGCFQSYDGEDYVFFAVMKAR